MISKYWFAVLTSVLVIIACDSNCTAARAQYATKIYSVVRQGSPHDSFYDLRFLGNTGIAVGDHGVIVSTRSGGQHWHLASNVPTQQALLGSTITAGHAIVVGQAGTVLTSTDLKSWTIASSGTNSRLFAVDLAPNGFAVAVGAFGIVLTSADYGRTWQTLKIDWSKYNADGYQPSFYAVNVAADDTVVIAGEFSLVLRSTNRGLTWAAMHKGVASIFAMRLLNNGTGYAVGQNGLVLKTSDAGLTWDKLVVPSRANLLGVWTDVRGRVVVVGMNAFFESENSGGTWIAPKERDVVDAWYEGVDAGGTGASRAVFAVGEYGVIARVH